MPTASRSSLEEGNRLSVSRQWPRHPGRRASQVSRQVDARSDPVDAAFGRQVLRQGLCHQRRSARRRRQRGQRPVVRHAAWRLRATRQLYAQNFSQRADARSDRKARPHTQPPRHHRHLYPRHRDFRRPAVQADAAVQAGPVQGLSVRRRRNPLEMRPQLGHRRCAGRSDFQVSRRAV